MTVKDYTDLLLPNTIVILEQISSNSKDNICQVYQIPNDILNKTIQTLTYDTIPVKDTQKSITNTSANIPNLLVNNNLQYVCPVIIT